MGPRKWGKGPRATKKKELIQQQLLDKYGKPTEQTPGYWTEGFLSEKDKQVKLSAKKNVSVKEVVAEEMEVDEQPIKKRKRSESTASEEPKKKKSKKESDSSEKEKKSLRKTRKRRNPRNPKNRINSQ